MNISTRTRVAGATATLGMLLAVTACGTDTVNDSDPGLGAARHPKVQKHGGYGTTADSAERRAAEEKARQDKASADRWNREQHRDNQLKYAGHPGRP